MVWINQKLKVFYGRMIVLLLLLSFGGMAGYSVLLHNHDLDSDHAHNDCTSCQWTQAHKTDKTDHLEITQTPTIHAVKYRTQQLETQTVHSGFYNRGPPTFS